MTESESTLNDEINDDEQQLIKLCLKKPKQWNWELTTSKSSSHIAFPTIELYDEHQETLLAQASEAGHVSGSKLLRKSASVSKASSLRSVRSRDSFKARIMTDSSTEEIVLQPIITEPDEEARMSKRESPASSQIHYERRSASLRDASSQEFRKSNEKPRTKPYSRSSSNSMRSRSSVSILERISELKRLNSSSDESEEENSSERKNRSINIRIDRVHLERSSCQRSI